MPSAKHIILLHSRQPLGAGTRSTLLSASQTKPVFLTDAQGIPFRDGEGASGIDVVVKDKAAWLDVIASHGDDVEVLTNDEFCLEECRRIRQALGKRDTLPGLITNYRDKWAMQTALRAKGIPTPKAVLIPKGELTPDTFARAAAEIGGTGFILKPSDEANLRGIFVVNAAAPVSAHGLMSRPTQTAYLIEEFLDGPQYHVDCIVDDGRVTPLLVGQYIAPLLDLADGRPSGSVSLERSDVRWSELAELADDAIQCLGSDGRFVAHVEFLSNAQGYRVGEVACRAPGGDVPWQSLVHCGVDLEVANLSLQLGLPAPQVVAGVAAAWVWIPGVYTPPFINKTYGVFAKRFCGTGWISQAKTSAELWQRVDGLLRDIHPINDAQG